MMVTDMMYEAALLLVVLAVTVKSDNNNPGHGANPPYTCPDGKFPYAEDCYWVVEDLKTYEGGSDACGDGGGKLAIFYWSQDVPNAVEALGNLVGSAKFWIGLNKDNNDRDQWQWNTIPSNQNENQKWRSGENQSPSNPGQRCGAGKKKGRLFDDWEWYSEDCGATFPSLCVDGELDPPEVNGDPHFLITSITEENTHLCFDINGEDEDVLILLQDADLELQVNGEMFSPKNEKFNQAFFSSISVIYGDNCIVATQDDITIDATHTVQWDSTYGIDLDEEASVSSVDKSTVQIALAYDVQMRIRRSQTSDGAYYLGLFITHNGGIGDHANGIMGNLIRSKFTVIPSIESESNGVIEFSEQPISVPVHRVTRYSRAHHGRVECWLYKVDSKAPEDRLLGKRSSYTASDLKFTPF